MVLTARNQPDDVRLAIELGARDFLTKPFRDNQLISRVGRLVHKAPASRPGPSLPPILLDDRPFR
jgi:two-component system OmpR family response regulator